MITENPDSIVVCKLECILMPQGEIICNGKTIGWLKDLGEFLEVKERK